MNVPPPSPTAAISSPPEPWADSRADRWYVAPDETRDGLLAGLRARGERTRIVVEASALTTIGQPSERWAGADPPPLERILFHLIQEYVVVTLREITDDNRDSVLALSVRISSARRAERVLLMDGARPCAGTHAELLAGSALYAELVGASEVGSYAGSATIRAPSRSTR